MEFMGTIRKVDFVIISPTIWTLSDHQTFDLNLFVSEVFHIVILTLKIILESVHCYK